MLAEIGLISVFLAFIAALYAIGASIYGAHIHSDRLIVSGRNAAIATFPLLLLATLALVVALLNGQYQMAYVWSVTDPSTPTFFRITALWGSQKGSLLFWSLLMSLFSVGAIILNWRSHRHLMPYATAYMMAVLAFFLMLTLFFENPFQRFWVTPGLPRDAGIPAYTLIPAGAIAPSYTLLANSASGLNPLLRHFGMIIHPPMLYLGFVGFVIPFAFAMAALASGDLSTNWIKATRRWALVAWLFLSLGLILGGRWAYDVLGWGGYWGWDPVENAAFLPWLVGTAFLHSVMIQEKRGMLKLWNMFLIIGAFSAVIFGTFATRSGLIDSVHSFASSNIGLPMLLFWALITVISVGMILWRWNQGLLKDEHEFASVLSRESLFVLNNVVFIALAVAIFWGSFGAPIVSELFLDTDITIGIEYYYLVTPPLFLALYILMGIAPLSAWGTTSVHRLGRALLIPLLMTTVIVVSTIAAGTDISIAILGYGSASLAGFVALNEIARGVLARRRGLGESWFVAVVSLFERNKRRYGGYVIHIGVTIIGIGVIGSTLFQVETQRTLRTGESLEIGGYELRFDNYRPGQIASDQRIIDAADMTLLQDGQEIAHISPRIDYFPRAGDSAMPMTIAGSHSTLARDVYVLLLFGSNANGATFKVYINPLINLVWYGGLILIIGTFIAGWPLEPVPAHLRERRQKVRSTHRPVGAPAS